MEVISFPVYVKSRTAVAGGDAAAKAALIRLSEDIDAF
jgi:hypothetical protein